MLLTCSRNKDKIMETHEIVLKKLQALSCLAY